MGPMCDLSLQHATHMIVGRYGLKTSGGYANRGTAIWIGANDEAAEGRFMWLPAGTPVVFDNWDGGQPNNKEGGQDCAVYYHGRKKWHDIKCNDKKIFICEGW